MCILLILWPEVHILTICTLHFYSTQKTQKSYIINETESVIYNCAISRFLLENISFNFGAVALIMFEPRLKVLFQALSPPPSPTMPTAWFVPAGPIGNIESPQDSKLVQPPSKGRPLMTRDLSSPIYYTINSTVEKEFHPDFNTKCYCSN
jgi:hypothetical protein